MSEDKRPTVSHWDQATKLAQIFAWIATPLLVGWIGWLSQASVATTGARKDFVQMSLQVLREPRRPNDESLRRWAHEIINRNSEVPLPAEAADQLSTSMLSMLEMNPLLKPAMEQRPPCPQIDLRELPQQHLADVAALQELCVRNAKDLFWVRTYLNMFRESLARAGSPAK